MITDQFTLMSISRQRKWQLRQQARGLCLLCKKRAVGLLCKEHTRISRKTAKQRYATSLMRKDFLR